MKQFDNIKIVVQIGANIGYDDLTSIIHKNKETINKFVAVEPMKLHNESLNKCYSNIEGFTIDNKIITTDPNQVESTLYYNTNSGPQYEISSLDPKHIKKHMTSRREYLQKGEIKSLQIKCETVNNLFKSHNLEHIDILAIDVEGFDLDLLLDIDFNLVNIRYIIYEHVHIDNSVAIRHLQNNGYHLNIGWGTGNWSTVAVRT